MLQKRTMQIIYPHAESKIYIPVELTGERGKTVFEIAHRNQNATVFWHLDENYIGKTKNSHQFEIEASLGMHSITLIDNFGEMLTFDFEIINE